MATFSWSSPCSSRILLFLTFLCLFSMIDYSEQATTDPEEVAALNTIFRNWGISAHPSWNISREPCNGTAIARDVTIDDQRYNPLIRCDCSYKNGTVCHITEMKVLNMNARGVIPVEFQKLTELKNLNLMQNYLTGPLPAFIGNLTKMMYLSFAFNALSGTIPKEFGKLQNLISLSFALNNFTGSLPSELGNLTKLEKLYADSAGLSGEIPSTFANLTRMRILFLSDNNFTGKLPAFIGNWTKMEEMKLQGNAFQGPIPASFSNLTALVVMRLAGLSNLSSSLEFINKMTSLKTLVLKNCMITGSLPSSIGGFASLQHVDLSFNTITGFIPESFFSLGSLKYLFLGNNNLSGALPSNKGSNLNVIDLSYNYFSGNLPSWATSIDNLQLNLAANNFKEDDLKSPKFTGLNCLQKDFRCNRNSPKYSSFAINSGGPTKSWNNTEFESDEMALGAASFYVTDNKRWAVSSVGRFIDSSNEKYIQSPNSSSKIPNSLNSVILQNVRLSADSIRYYGLGLENGNYTVNLQFVELDSGENRTWLSFQRRVFDIYIQGVLKEKNFNLMTEGGGFPLRGVIKDYNKIPVTANFLEIHLYWAGRGTCCIPSDGTYGPSIAAVSARPEFIPSLHSGGRNFGVIVGIPVGVGLLILLVILIAFILRRKMSPNNDEELQGLTSRAYIFSYAKMKAATDDFNPKNKLGEGGFGPVYKGMLSDGRAIAVKQLSLRSRQGKRQFVTEIDMISAVKHRNLVKLYGCCIEGSKRLLVYEYLENNSLEQALFGKSNLDLNWKIRFGICVGTAEALAYLHEESRPKIVHRDVKASNILLDAELKPKISDFGLAKLYDDKKTHMSTKVAGTIGYLAPEYAMRGYLTDKADVFGFGVVLLEIFSGRPNFVPELNPEQIYLLEWAWFLYENGRQMELVDPNLKDYNKEEAMRVFTIGLLCTQLSPSLRPTMSRVVSILIGDVELTDVPTKPGYLNDLNMSDVVGFPTTSSYSTSITQSSYTQASVGSNVDEPSKIRER